MYIHFVILLQITFISDDKSYLHVKLGDMKMKNVYICPYKYSFLYEVSLSHDILPLCRLYLKWFPCERIVKDLGEGKHVFLRASLSSGVWTDSQRCFKNMCFGQAQQSTDTTTKKYKADSIFKTASYVRRKTQECKISFFCHFSL